MVLYAGNDSDDDSDTHDRSSQARSPFTETGKLRALIVEDEAIIALEIEDELMELGVEVVDVAKSAEQAVILADAERPDFITMDISVQGDRDGVSAALEIYERFGIRSIFISAYGDSATVARAERASPLGWLGKPFHQDQLEKILQSVRPRQTG